jgi:hypothetical protein
LLQRLIIELNNIGLISEYFVFQTETEVKAAILDRRRTFDVPVASTSSADCNPPNNTVIVNSKGTDSSGESSDNEEWSKRLVPQWAHSKCNTLKMEAACCCRTLFPANHSSPYHSVKTTV